MDVRGRERLCVPCNCDPTGSTSTSCSADGKCNCLSNFGGKQCDQCSPGYYKYPECLRKFVLLFFNLTSRELRINPVRRVTEESVYHTSSSSLSIRTWQSGFGNFLAAILFSLSFSFCTLSSGQVQSDKGFPIADFEFDHSHIGHKLLN